jgi:hypothetical protein
MATTMNKHDRVSLLSAGLRKSTLDPHASNPGLMEEGVIHFYNLAGSALERIVFPHLEFPVQSFATDHQMIAGHFPRHSLFYLCLDCVIVPVSTLDFFQAVTAKELFRPPAGIVLIYR